MANLSALERAARELVNTAITGMGDYVSVHRSMVGALHQALQAQAAVSSSNDVPVFALKGLANGAHGMARVNADGDPVAPWEWDRAGTRYVRYEDFAVVMDSHRWLYAEKARLEELQRMAIPAIETLKRTGDELQAALGTNAPETNSKPRKCMADMYADPPRDCDAPYCGCNPAWDQCIEMLQECGWKSPDELRTSKGPSVRRGLMPVVDVVNEMREIAEDLYLSNKTTQAEDEAFDVLFDAIAARFPLKSSEQSSAPAGLPSPVPAYPSGTPAGADSSGKVTKQEPLT